MTNSLQFCRVDVLRIAFRRQNVSSLHDPPHPVNINALSQQQSLLSNSLTLLTKSLTKLRIDYF